MSCNFGVLAGEHKHTSFHSAIFCSLHVLEHLVKIRARKGHRDYLTLTLHFIDKETGSDRSSDLSQVTQLLAVVETKIELRFI